MSSSSSDKKPSDSKSEKPVVFSLSSGGSWVKLTNVLVGRLAGREHRIQNAFDRDSIELFNTTIKKTARILSCGAEYSSKI